jgi:predicted transcriptional regulator
MCGYSTSGALCLGPYLAFEAEQLAKIHRGIREADAGHFATAAEKEAVFNRFRTHRPERAG